MNPAAIKSSPSTKASMKRTGFSEPTYSSSDSGRSRVWDRSWPVMCDIPDSRQVLRRAGIPFGRVFARSVRLVHGHRVAEVERGGDLAIRRQVARYAAEADTRDGHHITV